MITLYIISAVVLIGLVVFLSLWFTNQPVQEWSDWSECNKPCGTGSQFRMCTQDATLFHSAESCGREERECNTHNCPVDGVLSEWTEWSGCPETCFSDVSHTENRNRTYIQPLYYGKHPDGYTNLSETRECAPKAPCPILIKPSDFIISGSGNAKPTLVTIDNNTSVKVYNSKNTHIYTVGSSDLSGEDIKEAVSFSSNQVTGSLSYNFIAPVTGQYKIMMRYRSGSLGKSDSVFIKMDTNPAEEWHVNKRSSAFGTNTKYFNLSAGQHILEISRRESGLTINSVRIEFVK